jgi:predicted nucleotidyltransferase
MYPTDDITRIIAESREQLRSEFGVVEIGVFGSVVRGEQGATSDIDVLVEFDRPIGFVRFMRLEERLTDLLGMPVDLVTKKALKPHIGKRILQEVRYV